MQGRSDGQGVEGRRTHRAALLSMAASPSSMAALASQPHAGRGTSVEEREEERGKEEFWDRIVVRIVLE